MGHFFPDLSYPFTGPCTRRVPRTWFCPVFHGARQLPFTTAVGHFFPVSTYSPFTAPCKGPCTRRVPRTWFCPVFHGARQLPSTTAVGQFFPVSTYSPFTGPCNGPCTCVCVVRGFAQFSMTRVRFRPRRASATFFLCPRVRVSVRGFA